MCNDVYIAGGGNPMRTPPYPIAPTYKTLTAAAAQSCKQRHTKAWLAYKGHIMKVQRVEWHSYQLVYEYEINDAEIEDKFGDIEIFREKLASDDEDFDDVYEYIMEEQDPVECYDWQYSQIKGGYETEWYSGEDCIEPRGNKTF